MWTRTDPCIARLHSRDPSPWARQCPRPPADAWDARIWTSAYRRRVFCRRLLATFRLSWPRQSHLKLLLHRKPATCHGYFILNVQFSPPRHGFGRFPVPSGRNGGSSSVVCGSKGDIRSQRPRRCGGRQNTRDRRQLRNGTPIWSECALSAHVAPVPASSTIVAVFAYGSRMARPSPPTTGLHVVIRGILKWSFQSHGPTLSDVL